MQDDFEPISLAPREIGRSEWFTLDEALTLLRGQGDRTFQPLLSYLEGQPIDLATKIQQLLIETQSI